MPGNSVAFGIAKVLAFLSLPGAAATIAVRHGESRMTPAAFEGVPIVEVEDPEHQVPIGADALFSTQVSINGASVRAILDGGSNATLLSRSDARRAGLTHGLLPFEHALQTLHGYRAVARANVSRLTLAGATFYDVPVLVAQDDTVPSIIGTDVMRRFREIKIADDVMELRS